jgi:hypothetical protein
MIGGVDFIPLGELPEGVPVATNGGGYGTPPLSRNFRGINLTKPIPIKRVLFRSLLPMCWNEQMPASYT